MEKDHSKKPFVITSRMLERPNGDKWLSPDSDTKGKMLNDWNEEFDEESKFHFKKFNDLYRFLREKAQEHGKGERHKKMDEQYNLRAKSREEFDRLFRYDRKLRRKVNTNTLEFWVRAKKIKAQEGNDI